jgi:hypothetical protein
MDVDGLFVRVMPIEADKSAVRTINRRLLVRQPSFGAGEIPSEAISDRRQSVKRRLTEYYGQCRARFIAATADLSARGGISDIPGNLLKSIIAPRGGARRCV